VIAAEIEGNHVTRAVREINHVTRAVRDICRPSRPDEGSWTPSTYREFLGTFSRKKAEMLLPHRSSMLSISGRAPSCHTGEFTAYLGPN
jgi:hypothetical protein